MCSLPSIPITFIANYSPAAIVILRSTALIRPICTMLLCRMIETDSELVVVIISSDMCSSTKITLTTRRIRPLRYMVDPCSVTWWHRCILNPSCYWRSTLRLIWSGCFTVSPSEAEWARPGLFFFESSIARRIALVSPNGKRLLLKRRKKVSTRRDERST